MDNMDRVLKRGEQLEAMADKSEALVEGAEARAACVRFHEFNTMYSIGLVLGLEYPRGHSSASCVKQTRFEPKSTFFHPADPRRNT